MSSTAQAYPLPGYASLRIPAAAFEVLVYLAVVAVASLCFLAGWLTVNGAVVLTVVLLTSLIVMSWIHLGQGRHPCFLFLCMLLLFQGGRLIGYCLGAEPEPMRVQLMGMDTFNFSRNEQGLVLLCVVLSAICLYAPCRWNYHRILPPDDRPVRTYLPYLYLVFFATLPIQAFKNYRYYDYAQQHGGYLYIYLNHAGLASSVPFIVRFVSLITFPVFVALFVFEKRKKYLYLVAGLYVATASFILLLGQRSTVFALAVSLWYVAQVKSGRKPRVLRSVAFVATLVLLAVLIQVSRENPEQSVDISDIVTAPADFLVLQGASLGVTQVAVRYRDMFWPYASSYLLHEVQNAFVASDASNYYRGKLFAFDVSVFLNPVTFSLGQGTGGSYVGEAYILGGVPGVIAISLLLGAGLRRLYRMSARADLLFVVAMILSDVLWMPRGVLLDWFSAFIRNLIAILLLIAGWWTYRLITSIRHMPAGSGSLTVDAGMA